MCCSDFVPLVRHRTAQCQKHDVFFSPSDRLHPLPPHSQPAADAQLADDHSQRWHPTRLRSGRVGLRLCFAGLPEAQPQATSAADCEGHGDPMSAPILQTRAGVRLDTEGHMEVDGVAFLGNIGRGSYGEVVVGRDSKNGGKLVVSSIQHSCQRWEGQPRALVECSVRTDAASLQPAETGLVSASAAEWGHTRVPGASWPSPHKRSSASATGICSVCFCRPRAAVPDLQACAEPLQPGACRAGHQVHVPHPAGQGRGWARLSEACPSRRCS